MHSPAIYLSFNEDTREAVHLLGPTELAADNGFEKVICSLDGVYQKDETIHVSCAVKSLVDFCREGELSFLKFLVEFNNRYRKLKSISYHLNMMFWLIFR